MLYTTIACVYVDLQEFKDESYHFDDINSPNKDPEHFYKSDRTN